MPSNSYRNLFSEKANAYADYRPGYPSEVVDKLLEPFDHTSEIHALDMGAGTGIASRLLAERGVHVLAAEPNESMIRHAEPHPGITFQQMGAEDMDLGSGSVDLATTFQAFHWFNFKKSLKEFNRVLKPSGRLGLIWSYWDSNDAFTSSYAQLINQAADQNPDRVSPYDGFPEGSIKNIRIKILWKLRYLPYFKNVQRYRYRYVQNMDLEALVGCARSQSFILHHGSAWEQLVDNIKRLHEEDGESRLVYAINLFIASPRK